ALRVGERVVIPFTIICGECEQCKRGNFSVCERSNRNKQLGDKVFGHSTAGLFGYTHLTGGYAGGQAEYLRVPFADATHIKVPDGIPDEKLLFLSDIFPTGWQGAVQCDIQPTDTVATCGCGPVGQMTSRSAILLGARQAMRLETDRPDVLREMRYGCRPAGVLSIPDVYGGLVDKLPVGAVMNKGLTILTGNTHVNRGTVDLLSRVLETRIDPSFVI